MLWLVLWVNCSRWVSWCGIREDVMIDMVVSQLRTGIRTEFLFIDTWPFVVTMYSKLLCLVQKHKSELCGQKYLKVKIILLHWRTFVGSKCGIFLRVEAGKERFRLDKRKKGFFVEIHSTTTTKKNFTTLATKRQKTSRAVTLTRTTF